LFFVPRPVSTYLISPSSAKPLSVLTLTPSRAAVSAGESKIDLAPLDINQGSFLIHQRATQDLVVSIVQPSANYCSRHYSIATDTRTNTAMSP